MHNDTAKLTDTCVRSLRPPAQGQATRWDPSLPGFGIRVSAGGSKAWVVMYRYAGRARRLTLGHYPQLALADARLTARDTFRAIARGEDPGTAKRMKTQAPTFKELVDEYVERYAKPKKRSWQKDVFMFRLYIPAGWGCRPAAEISRRDIRNLVETLAERIPVQANRVLALLRKLFNFGVEREIVPTSPCVAIARPTREKPRERVLTAGEIDRLFRALGAEDRQSAALVKLYLLTAQRGGELRTMEWDHVDFEESWWTIPSERAKNGLAHRVPLSPSAIDVLRNLHAHRTDQRWVFPVGRWHPQAADGPRTTIQQLTSRLRKRSGVDFQPHDLRRTVASHMTSMGIPRLTVQKLLNHVERGVTAVYDRHSYDAEKRKALDDWAIRLDTIVQSRRLPALSAGSLAPADSQPTAP